MLRKGIHRLRHLFRRLGFYMVALWASVTLNFLMYREGLAREYTFKYNCGFTNPNEIAIVAAQLPGTVIYAILAETGLEFLGLGDITSTSWGTMLYWAANNDALLLGAWWWFIAPGLCIAVLGAGLAFINFGIDEIANPRLRKESRRRLPRFKKVDKHCKG